MNERQAQDVVTGIGKVIFADQLRAVAALCVLIVHLLGMYWHGRSVVASHIFAPVLEGPSAKSLALISPKYFNFGPFGVALFFLISGFVIPFSLAKARRVRFLVARVLRIYPTYAACLALGLFIVWLSSRFWNVPFGWGLTQILHNVLLANSITGIDSIDMVNWSLAIEIKFYLIAAMLASSIAHGRLFPLVGVSLGVAMIVAWVAYVMPAGSNSVNLHFTLVHFNLLAHDLLFIPFMFVGTVFFYRFRGLISRVQLFSFVAVFFGIFIASWPHTILKDYFPLVPLNYFYALMVFGTAYALRAYFRSCRPLDWLASISYPLYALHSLIGYAMIRFLGAIGITYYLAFVLATAGIMALAYAIHRVVEMPTQDLGKRILRGRVLTDGIGRQGNVA